MTFNAADASVEGFRVIRRQPMVILWWTLAYIAMMAVLAAAIGGPFLALMPQLEALSGTDPSPEQVMSIFGGYGLIVLLAFPIAIAFSAILSTAVARSVLSPDESRLGYLRFGKDELRVAVVTLVLGLLLMVVYVIAIALVFILAGIGSVANTGLAILLGFVGGCAGVALVVWLAVKFSLAVPITYAEKRIAIFDSFNVTKGHFWGLLGMAVIAGILAIAVSLLGSMIAMPFQMMSGPAMENAAETGDMAQVFAAIGPWVVVTLLIQMVISALQLPVMYAPFSTAYRGIRGSHTEISKTFE